LSDTNSDGVPDTVASNSRSQSWSFDALGNWSSVTTNGTAQNRTANQQNQITSITGLTTPVYDADGRIRGLKAYPAFSLGPARVVARCFISGQP
jgi:hypothetical protein